MTQDTRLSLKVINRFLGWAQSDKVGHDTFGHVIRVDDFRYAAWSAFFGGEIETRSVSATVYLHTGKLISVQVTISTTFIAFLSGLVEQLTIRKYTEFTD